MPAPLVLPGNVAGVRSWLKADSISLANGAGLTSWPDSSGNNAPATATTGTPTFQANVQNGLPSVRFTGSQLMSLPSGFASGFTAGTIFIVIKAVADPPGAAATSGIWSFGSDTAGGTDTHYPYTDGTIYDDWGSTTRKTTVNPTPSLAQFNVYSVISAAGAWTSWLNNAQLYTTSSNTVGFPTSPLLGGGATVNFNGDIGEVLIYNSALSTADRASVFSYLKARWGTP